jgi:hypothetical protein
MLRIVAGLVGQGVLIGLALVGLLVLTVVVIGAWFAGNYPLALGGMAIGIGGVALWERISHREQRAPFWRDDEPAESAPHSSRWRGLRR